MSIFQKLFPGKNSKNRHQRRQENAVGRRFLGLKDARPIFEPNPAHSLLISAAGGGKTTRGAAIWLLSMLSDHSKAIVVSDGKDGELAAQFMHLCAAHGRKVALIDDMDVFPPDHPFKVRINPLGGVIASHLRDKGEVLFAADAAAHALIEDPAGGDDKNKFFKDEARVRIEYVLRSLLAHNERLSTPGGVWTLLSNPDTFYGMAEIDAEEGDPALAALARHVLDARAHDENNTQHHNTALLALKVFSAGSPLHHTGSDSDVTHLELLKENYIVFIVGPQRQMDQLSPHNALNLQSFADALLSGEAGPSEFILDEFTNANLKQLIMRLTVIRAYGGRLHMIAQSRSEIERKYGKLELATIEENALVKMWFGFSSFDEAERVSRAMGERLSVTKNLGYYSDKMAFSGGWQTTKQRVLSADDLMSLPINKAVGHVKSVGFFLFDTIAQNEVAPYCFELADNPLEGGRLPPNPKIALPTERRS